MHFDTYKAAKFTANNWHDATIDITGKCFDKSNNNCANIDLVEFKIHIKTLVVNNTRETCYR